MSKKTKQKPEARQQRLDLTWSGTNEGPDVDGLSLDAAKKLVITASQELSADLTEEELDIMAASAEMGLSGEELDDLIEQSEPKPKAPKLKPKASKLKLKKPAKKPALYEEEHGTTTTSMLAISPVEINEEFSHQPLQCEESMSHQEGAEEPRKIMLTKPAPPVELSHETPVPEANEKKLILTKAAPVVEEVVEEEPKKLKLTKAAPVVQEEIEEEEVVAAVAFEEEPVEEKKLTLTKPTPSAISDEEGEPRPALKLMQDEDGEMASSLKPKLNLKKSDNNTCKLQPVTQELVAGESLGGKLRKARDLSQMTVFEIAEKTRISSEYITALEEENFENLPLASIYIKSYLKTLARTYGIDADELIAEYEEKTGVREKREKPKKTTTEADEDTKETEKDSKSMHLLAIAMGVAAALVLGVAGLAYAGPKFDIPVPFSELTEAEMAVIDEAGLEQAILPEFLQYRKMRIPGGTTAGTRF